MSPMAMNRKTFAERTFSKVGPGSIRGSIFALSNAAIGAGVLSLPYVFRLNGWLVAVVYIITGACAAIWSNRILARSACELNVANYNDLCKKAGGKKASNLLLISLLTYVFGSLCSYQIILTSMFQWIIVQFGVDKELAYSKSYATYFAIPMAAIVLYPLSIMRDMSALRYASLFSLMALFYTAIVMVVEAPSYYNHFSKLTTAHPIYIDWNLFNGFSMICFSYSCQIQLLPLYSELEKPSLPRMNKIIVRSSSVNFVFYMIIGLAGYVS